METNALLKSAPGRGKLLSPDNLARDFGPRSAISKRCVAKLWNILRAGHPALAGWKLRFGRILGTDWQRSEKALHACARKLGIECDELKPDVFLFALQAYYAVLLQLLVRRFRALARIDFSEEPFSVNLWAEDAELAGELKCLSAAMEEYSPSSENGAFSSGDLLKALYQELFPRALRHRLGEYYTPDWLARHVLDQVGYSGRLKQRLLDPACGSGTFLLTAIGRIRAARLSSQSGSLSNSSKSELCRHILSHVVGIDLNPLGGNDRPGKLSDSHPRPAAAGRVDGGRWRYRFIWAIRSWIFPRTPPCIRNNSTLSWAIRPGSPGITCRPIIGKPPNRCGNITGCFRSRATRPGTAAAKKTCPC